MHIMNIFLRRAPSNEMRRNLQMNKNRSSGPDTFSLPTAPFGGQHAAVIKRALLQGGSRAARRWGPTLFITGRSRVRFPQQAVRQLSVRCGRRIPTCLLKLPHAPNTCRKCQCGAHKPPRMWHVSCCKHSLLWQSNHLDHGRRAQGQIKDICPLFFSFCNPVLISDLIFWPRWNNQLWRYFCKLHRRPYLHVNAVLRLLNVNPHSGADLGGGGGAGAVSGCSSYHCLFYTRLTHAVHVAWQLLRYRHTRSWVRWGTWCLRAPWLVGYY